jgi:ATP-dependent Zn protease
MESGYLATLPLETMMNSALAQDYYSKLDGILQRELNEAKEIINANKNKVEALAQALCDRSKLDTGEMRIILDDDVNRAKR